MNQLEEFNLYCLQQLNDAKNISYYVEDPKEEEIIEEKENYMDNKENKPNIKKIRIRKSTSKRSLPKRYQTYTLDYKKQVIAEVNKNIIINYILIGCIE